MRLADGAFGSLRRISRAPDIAIFGDSALAPSQPDDDRAGGHEFDKLAEERPRFVHGIEGLGLLAGHADALLRHDAQPRLLDQRVDRAGQVTRRRVGLDDRESTFGRHSYSLGYHGGSLPGLYRRLQPWASDPVTRPVSAGLRQFHPD